MQDQRETTEGLEQTTEFVNDPAETPVAAPEDYAAEDELAGSSADISDAFDELSPGGPAQQEVAVTYGSTEWDDTPAGQRHLRQWALSQAVAALGPECGHESIEYVAETIRRSEQFIRYVRNGSAE